MPATNIDEGKLNAFIGQMLSDLGGASSIAMVRLGDTLGLYKAIHANGPMTSMELAKAAKVDERYLREWLSHQAASNYLSYDPATSKFAMPPEQAMVFANEESPVYMMGGSISWRQCSTISPRCRRRSSRAPVLLGAIKQAACSVR